MASSAASSSKRKRSEQSKTPPPAQAVVEKWSHYFNDPEADVILRSVSGRLFATKRAYLVAASSVFEDMFKIPQPVDVRGGARKDGQAAPGVLPVAEMTETGSDLAPFLRWIHRDTFEVIYRLIEDAESLEDVRSYVIPLLACAKKFEVKSMWPPIRTLLEEFIGDDTANVLALSVIYEWRSLAQRAVIEWLSEVDDSPRVDPGPHENTYALYNIRTKVLQPGVRPWSIAYIWPELFGLLPPGFFLSVAAFERDMLFRYDFDRGKSVDDFMNAFDSGFSLHCASHTLSRSTNTIASH